MKYSQIIALVAFMANIAVLAVNYLANSLPLNGYKTGELSAFYENLFVPAGFTFAIWGLIYLLQQVFVVYGLFAVFNTKYNEQLFLQLAPWFIAICIANITWLFLWHYRFPGLSAIVMLVFLLLLIKSFSILLPTNSLSESTWYASPFIGIYLGWISIALIANITAFLVSINWNAWLIDEVYWSSIMILIGLGITLFMVMTQHSYVYGMVVLWAFWGVFYKQNQTSSLIGIVAITSMLFIAAALLFKVFKLQLTHN